LQKNLPIIECEHYGEIFNPKQQNFRLQKQYPALILAQKQGDYVLPTPEGFGIGGQHNYYFSHMLNCLYDCRYCFLQGMYPSGYFVLFINYEDFMTAIDEKAQQLEQPAYFFSGYDCDSLAYEPMTEFVKTFLPFFAERPKAIFELRTKTTNVKSLLKYPPLSNCVSAFSFTPEAISQQVEHKVPSVAKRLQAVGALAQQGWPIGIRLDPLIYTEDFKEQYQRLIELIFQHISAKQLHSVSLGPMRFPHKMYHKLVKLYPQDSLLAHPFEKRQGQMTYGEEREQMMEAWVRQCLRPHMAENNIFSCHNL
jgi:spore photoproduct lyase